MVENGDVVEGDRDLDGLLHTLVSPLSVAALEIHQQSESTELVVDEDVSDVSLQLLHDVIHEP